MRKVLRACFGLAGLWLGVSGTAWADDVQQWLTRMDQAMASISYRGTLVRMGNGRMDTLRVVRRVGEDGIRERIHALDGPPREVLREQDQIRCLISGQASVVVDTPFPARILGRVRHEEVLGSESVYKAHLLGTDRVAARDARVIDIIPADPFRYGRRLWLDSETGMLLRSVIFSADGGAVERLGFVEIELGVSISDRELESDLKNPTRVRHYKVSDRNHANDGLSRQPSWLPENLPAGFRLTSVGRDNSEPERYEHLLFSDGLAHFSIYIEPVGASAIAEEIEARGAMHIYTGTLHDNRITVVGEVPAATVRLIGRHLRRADRPESGRPEQ
jgi:sigma-E factor negative regulatory protein RseB